MPPTLATAAKADRFKISDTAPITNIRLKTECSWYLNPRKIYRKRIVSFQTLMLSFLAEWNGCELPIRHVRGQKEEGFRMNKPQLCLSLTLSLALLQANLLQASATPGSAAIWEKLAGASQTSSTGNKKTAKKKTTQVVKKSSTLKRSTLASAGTYNAAGIANGGSNGQVALFFGKNKEATAATKEPGAALTIHSPMSENEPAPAAAVASSEAPPKIVAMDNSVVSDASAVSAVTAPAVPVAAPPKPARELLAQLAPDQLLADASDAYPTGRFRYGRSGRVQAQQYN